MQMEEEIEGEKRRLVEEEAMKKKTTTTERKKKRGLKELVKSCVTGNNSSKRM